MGPSSYSPAIIEKMITGGMRIARLNFSHGSFSDHEKTIKMLRHVSRRLNQIVTIFIDLPGSKIRVGTLQSPEIFLEKGDRVTLTTREVRGTSTLIPVLYQRLPESVRKGSKIYINDGRIELRTVEKTSDEVHCTVTTGGSVLSHKGINIPEGPIFLESVTEKDLRIVKFGLSQGVNVFGVSFIQNADDILKVRHYAEQKGKSVFLIGKIERRDAIRNFDQILQVADGVMIARGDLGIEIPIQEVPLVQKDLIRRANRAGRPVITATQMLESMTENTRPTRAETTDVANAILDGADAIMLSEETAIGRYPVETVRMMARIAGHIERNRNRQHSIYDIGHVVKNEVSAGAVRIADIISLNVIEATKGLRIRYILTPTESGNTARRIARFKPDCWILAFSRNKNTVGFLPFSYGVHPFFISKKSGKWHRIILEFIKGISLVKKGDTVILTQRRFASERGGTDSIGILTVEE
jgi:pyruvate kinase